MALGYEFAPIDVSIMTHPKAFAAGVEAMGLWLWGMAFAKQHRTGGRVHRAAVLGAWGGKRNIMHAKRLVEAGLWHETEDGDWDIYNFEKKGPQTSTSRVQKHRKNRTSPPLDETDETLSETVCNAFPKRSPSYSVSTSVSVSSPGEPERGSVPDAMAPPPTWWPDVLETLRTSTGETLPDRESWLRYAGHREGKASQTGRPYPATRGDALQWLTTVMVQEARTERDKARRLAERDAKFDRQRAGPLPPTERQTLTEAEQKDLAERFPMVRRKRGESAA